MSLLLLLFLLLPFFLLNFLPVSNMVELALFVPLNPPPSFPALEDFLEEAEEAPLVGAEASEERFSELWPRTGMT